MTTLDLAAKWEAEATDPNMTEAGVAIRRTLARELRALNQWRPASEPPDKPAWVIVMANTVCQEPITATFNGKTWTDDDGDEILGVTHWMPLPEPPKEKA